jgi:adenylate cyclase class 2
MKTEYELRVLEIDKKEIIKKLEELGAKRIGEYNQRRYIYDFKPALDNKWIRLRTGGEKTTLTIKQIDSKEIDGTKELEIEVSNFDDTNQILNQLGYNSRLYQENIRELYILDDVEFEIDSWPLIPTYMEIEGKSKEAVEEALKLLDINNDKVTCLDVQSIYLDIYGIDIDSIEVLKFEE